MPIPYGRSFKQGRTNRGFIDLRGRPAEANRIKEALHSPMMRELLMAAAQPAARIFTIGCDLGAHHESDKVRFREVAGGYFQFALCDYAEATPEMYSAEADRLERALKLASVGHRWRAVLQFHDNCVFRLGRDPETEAPTMTVYFWALGIDNANALMSREAQIRALKMALLSLENELGCILISDRQIT